MYEVKLHDRRILTARVTSCDTVDEARSIALAIRDALTNAPGLVVATADFRAAALFKPEVTEVLVAILKSDNPKVERSGHVVGGSAISALQIERTVREAGNPARRVFRSIPDVEAYLGEVLTLQQRAWLHAWYVEGTPGSSAPGA